jgi:hypothetical protein
MRDPARIPQILKALEEVWRSDPDLRFGQLVVNATNFSGRRVVCPEIFYAEDDALLAGICNYQAKVAAANKEKNA